MPYDATNEDDALLVARVRRNLAQLYSYAEFLAKQESDDAEDVKDVVGELETSFNKWFNAKP